MKMAKIFAIMFAVILAVFCLSGPYAFGGDEHPWDEEGGGGINGGGYNAVPPSDNSGTVTSSSSSSSEVLPRDESTIVIFLKIAFVLSTAI